MDRLETRDRIEALETRMKVIYEKLIETRNMLIETQQHLIETRELVNGIIGKDRM